MKKKTVSKKTYNILIYVLLLTSFLVIAKMQQKYGFSIWIAVLAATGLDEICREIVKIFFEANEHEDKKCY